MRKAITIALTVTALALPSVNAVGLCARRDEDGPEEEGRHRDEVVHRRRRLGRTAGATSR